MLRPQAQRGRQVRTTVAAIRRPDRSRQGLRPELSGLAQPRTGQGHRRHDEARLPARRPEPHPEDREATPSKYFRQVFFICDEYQHFATVGENDPSGDEKFFALSRQPKCIPIVATQSISSLRSTLPGETWRTLLQTFRTKIFLALSDDFSAKIASELCGREDQWKVNYNISESGHDARVSLWTGKAIAHKANVTTSKSYNTPERLPLRLQDLHGNEERAVRDFGLRRAESSATDFHVPETLLQRREQVVFPPARGWRTLMTTNDGL